MAFDKDFLDARGDELHRLEQQLTEELAWLQESAKTVDLDQTQFGRLSRIDAIGQQEMQKAAVQQTANRLKRVLRALRKLDEDDYGWCEKCGEPIEQRRLAVQPEVLYCMRCQDASERG